jgi:hypothetical protein
MVHSVFKLIRNDKTRRVSATYVHLQGRSVVKGNFTLICINDLKFVYISMVKIFFTFKLAQYVKPMKRCRIIHIVMFVDIQCSYCSTFVITYALKVSFLFTRYFTAALLLSHCTLIFFFCIALNLIVYAILTTTRPLPHCIELSSRLSIYGSTALCWSLAAFSVYLYLLTRYDSLDGGSARRNAASYTQNKHIQTSMPWMRFEPTISAFERTRTVHEVLVYWIHCGRAYRHILAMSSSLKFLVTPRPSMSTGGFCKRTGSRKGRV